MKKLILFVALIALVGVVGWPQSPNEATRQLVNAISYDSVDVKAVQTALDAGANPNYEDTSVPNPGMRTVLGRLSVLCSTNASDNPGMAKQILGVFQLLFDHGAQLQDDDRNILFFPVAGGHTEIVRLLLTHGAGPSWSPSVGTKLTPVEYAQKEGYNDIVALLVENGAEPLKAEQAIQVRFVETAHSGSIAALDELMSQGAQVNGPNSDNQTPLISAIDGAFGYSTVEYLRIKYLLDKGAEVNMTGYGVFGTTTPLCELAWISSIVERNSDRWNLTEKILELLLARGAFVSGTDDDGKTPLHIAAKENGLKTAKIFLTAGAKVMSRDKMGKTPLDYAQSGEMIKLLKQYGAVEQ